MSESSLNRREVFPSLGLCVGDRTFSESCCVDLGVSFPNSRLSVVSSSIYFAPLVSWYRNGSSAGGRACTVRIYVELISNLSQRNGSGNKLSFILFLNALSHVGGPPLFFSGWVE